MILWSSQDLTPASEWTQLWIIKHTSSIERCVPCLFYSQENHRIKTSGILRGIANGVVGSSGSVVTATCLMAYTSLGHELEVSKVFRTFLYCNMLQFACNDFVRTIQQLGQALISMERIEACGLASIVNLDTTIPLEKKYNLRSFTGVLERGMWL